MGRVYSVAVSAVATATAIKDIVELRPATNKPCEIIGFFMGQSSDSGDAAAEGLDVRLLRIDGTEVSGSGGTTPTPEPRVNSDAAAGAGADANNTTVATGTLTDLHADAWNVQMPFIYEPAPDARPVIINGEYFVVRISAPADALTISFTLVFKEFG